MIPPTEVVAFTGALTGGGSTDYCSDLYMPDTLEGYVSVLVECIDKGLLAQIEYDVHGGPTASPTYSIFGSFGQLTAITDAAWTRLFNVRNTTTYFRVSLTSLGNPSGSDVIVKYYYLPKTTPALQIESINNSLYITNE